MRGFVRFICRFLLTILILGALVTAFYVYIRHIEPNMLTINKEKIKDSSHNLRIVFFSDTHFGSTYKTENIEKIVEKINSQDADLVIFGGDFIDKYSVDKELIDDKYISENLEKIEAKYGKFAVWGNHDRGGGAERIYEEIMTSGGFKILMNESIYLENEDITIKGLDDYLLGNPDVSICEYDNEGYTILVTHAPDIADEANLSEIDFVLGAHSHGGQVKLPFLTKRILPKGARKYTKGMYDIDENGKLFVSKGLGTTQLPYRFLNTPEIVVLEIER